MEPRRPLPRLVLRLLCLACLAVAPALRAHGPGEEMADAANHWLAALTAEQRAVASFELDATERQNWNFVPLVRST